MTAFSALRTLYLPAFVKRVRTLGFLPTARELAAYYRRYVGLVRGLGATPETRYRLEVLKEYLRFVKYLPDPPEHPMLDYVPSWFGKHYLARRTNPPSQKDILVNKIRFYQYMAEQGIACPRTFFYSHQGRFYDLAGRPCDVAQYDGQTFFVKTIGGSEGIGADIICFRPPGDRRAEDLLYQELLVPHRALAAISPVRAMPTLRVNSYFTKGGRVEILSALIKFAGPGAVADNMAAGAIGVGIDPLEGRLHAEGVSKQGRRTSEGRAITAHPISGIPFEGFQVPCWHECVALLDRLHPLFPNLRAIGWDLAVTEAGPVVIEGNSVGALLFEQVFSRPFFGTTYVQENLGGAAGAAASMRGR